MISRDWTCRHLAPRRSGGVLAVLFVLVALPAAAGLGGYVDLSGNRTDTDGLRRESFRQEYNVSWDKGLTPYVDVRAMVRYYKFDQDVDVSLSTFQEEFQPLAEIIWRHPLFTLTTSAFRREAHATALTGNITTDGLLASFKTQDERYPLLGVRYDWQHVFDTVAGFERDVRNERLQVTADYIRLKDILNYTFNDQYTSNVVSDVQSTRREHRARWFHSESRLADGHVDLQFNYNFSYAEQIDEVKDGSVFLELVPLAAGLYLQDDSPDLGTLEPVSGLSDGNTAAPTVPPIDIGGATTGRNIGVDLGFERPIAALYVSTAGLSGIQPTWRIFISNDNLNWSPWSFSGPVVFNAALSRYEFSFEAATARYIKVVKDGVNELLDVLVTEIQALQEVDVVDDQVRIGRAHYADARVAYTFNDRLTTALDGSMAYDDADGPTGDRTSLDYSWRTNWLMTEKVSHQVRWSQSFIDLDVGDDQRDDVVSYALLYEPLETISTSAGALARWNYVNDLQDTQQRNVFVDLSGRVVPRLNASVGGTVSRIETIRVGTINDVATGRASFDGRVARWLDLGVTYTYQDFSGEPDIDHRVRRVGSANFNWRISRTIFARGRVSRIWDDITSLRQDYLLSWNLLPRLSVSGQVFIDRDNAGRESERFSGNATYEIASRSMAYFRWNRNDLTGFGGTFTETLQLGLRIGL